MPSIFAYRRYFDTLISRELRFPVDPATHQRLGTELATVDGVTYVSLPDGAVLPADQSSEIAATVAAVTLTPALRLAISNASPHVALIQTRVREKIREKFSLEDEVGLLRSKLRAPAIANPAFDAYDTFAESARAWAAAEKTRLGLG
jgi:hypothetical protein